MGRQWDGSVEEDYIQEYRPISILGILSLVLAVIGFSAMYFPSMGLVGLLAIALGILAVILQSRRPASMGWLAYVGIFLALFSITWSQATRSSYEARLLATASQHGQQWLQLIADNRVNEAICLRMEYLDRPLEGTDLVEYFKQTDRPTSSHSMMPAPKDMKEMFTKKKTIQNMIISGEQTAIRPVPSKDVIAETERGVAKILTHYDVDLVLGGNKETVEIVVEIYRIKFPTHVQWQVRDLENKTHTDVNIAELLGEGMKQKQ